MSLPFCSLTGQTALVTGASRGIGSVIAKRLAAAGATIILNYRSNKDEAEKVLKEVREFSPKSEMAAFDVSEEKEVEKAVAELNKKFPKIEILVCNAGLSRDQLFIRASGAAFEETMKTNFMGAVHLSRLLSRQMMKERYGRILLMSSVVGEMGNKGQAPYSASKSALFGFSKSVALELASRGITCNVICPGFIETDMTRALDEATQKTYMDRIPAGRFGATEDVAALVQFLASKEAGYITGATVDINGGLLMR